MLGIPDNASREDVLRFLAASASYGNLGLFIGAGFSKAVLNDEEEGALSWGELLKRAAEKMGVKYKTIPDDGVSYPEIASRICMQHAKSKKKPYLDSSNVLKDTIAALTSWYPTQEHRDSFLAYLEAFNPSWIITTNYDLVIESILTGKSIPLGPNDPLSSPKGVVPVFHLHGIRTNPREIIISQEDYVALFRPTEYRQIKLALTIKESTTVFLGYGLGDVNVLTALDWSKNVFREEKVNYPHDAVQVLRTKDPVETPYRDKNGICILEATEIAEFFEEFGSARSAFLKKEHKDQEKLEALAKKFKAPRESMVAKFIDDALFRSEILAALSKSSVFLLPDFVSFLDQCIDETWKRAAPRNAFGAYAQNLTIVLDILMAFSLASFPPLLLRKTAESLNRVGAYIGDKPGYSYAAKEVWDERASALKPDIVRELRNISAQYHYKTLANLMDSISK